MNSNPSTAPVLNHPAASRDAAFRAAMRGLPEADTGMLGTWQTGPQRLPASHEPLAQGSTRTVKAPRLSDSGQHKLALRFRIITGQELKDQHPPAWLVREILVANSLAAIIGPFATFKSFIILGLAAAIANGLDWFGHQTQQGPVLYVSGEGSTGLKNRVLAWEKWFGQDMKCHFLTQAVQMLADEQVQLLLEAIKAMPEPPVLIVLDTLARCLVGGDENSARDMGQFVAALDTLRLATGATVLVIHHVGKSGDTRGSTALPGAMDTLIHIERHEDEVTLNCKKQKDAAEFEGFTLVKRIVSLHDREGAHVPGPTSLVFERTDSQPRRVKENPTEKLMLRILSEQFPDGVRATPWQEACEGQGIPKRTFYDHRDSLVRGLRIIQKGTYYYPVEIGANGANAPHLAPIAPSESGAIGATTLMSCTNAPPDCTGEAVSSFPRLKPTNQARFEPYAHPGVDK